MKTNLSSSLLPALAACILGACSSCMSAADMDRLAISEMPGSSSYRASEIPVETLASWTAQGGEHSYFAWDVSPAGDVDGDGYDDVLVTEPYYLDQGGASLYMGSASGLSPKADWIARAVLPYSLFGYSASTTGDVDRDGYADVVVGDPIYDGQTAAGKAYLYRGSTDGLSLDPSWTDEGDQVTTSFGRVTSSGDVNGDGFGDVLVAADHYDETEKRTFEGAVFLYPGSGSGLSAAPSSVVGPEAKGRYGVNFGRSMSGAGDVNGDGYDDVVVGAEWSHLGKDADGKAWLFHGSASGLSATAAWTAEADRSGADFASAVSAAGDVNGDGYGDVLVAANMYDNELHDEGRAYLYAGSPSGLATSPAWTVETDQGTARGYAVSSAGDVNGDGYGDVILGAHYYENGEAGEGRVWLFEGSAAGLPATPAWMAETDRETELFGYSVSSAGDVDGDGYGDVIVGALGYNDENGDWVGRAYLFPGSPCGLGEASWYADVDGDGHGDPSVATVDCSVPDGYVSDSTDCDDTSASVYPGAPEIPGDGIDQDCDGSDIPDTGTIDTDTSETGKKPIDTKGGDTSNDSDTATEGKVPRRRCGCGAGAGGASWLMGCLAAVGLIRRRRLQN